MAQLDPRDLLDNGMAVQVIEASLVAIPDAACAITNDANDTATLSGIVTDSSGQSVPGARVMIENTGTGLVRAYITTEDGAYLFPALPVGAYRLQVEKEGFPVTVRTVLRSMSTRPQHSR